MCFEVVLDDLVFYIKSSWTPKNTSVNPCLGTSELKDCTKSDVNSVQVFRSVLDISHLISLKYILQQCIVISCFLYLWSH